MTGYAYSDAVAISARKRLLSKSKLLSMAECPSADDALSILIGGGFGLGEEAEGAVEYEKLVVVENRRLRELIFEYVGNRDFIAYCYLKGDFFNADVAVRRIILGLESVKYTDDAITPIEKIEAYVRGESKDLPSRLAKTVDELVALCRDGKATGKTLSEMGFKGYYACALKTIKNRLIRDFVVTEIDCANVSAYFRCNSVEDAERGYIDGGKLKKQKLSAIFSKSAERTRSAFLFTPYYKMIDACVTAREDGKPLTVLEKLVDDYPVKKIDGVKYEVTGIVPWLSYYLYKRAELKNVRTVMSGKLAKAESELIAGRLRRVYGE